MRKPINIALALTLAAPVSALAQAPAGPEQGRGAATIRLSVDEAVKMALDQNVDLKADRLDPQIGDTRVAVASGAFRPSLSSTVLRNNQLQPPASLLAPVATRTDVTTSTVGIGQMLPRFGTSYNFGWTTAHTSSDSFLNSYNPLLQSGLTLGVSQPLVKNFLVDSSRTQLQIARTNRDIAGTRLRDSEIRTASGVKSAYWNLVSARANVDARQTAVDLAQELARVNKAKVDVGQSPPLDEVSAQAEVASDEEQLIIAQTNARVAEDRLRMLLYDPTDRSIWSIAIEPVDAPPTATVAVDIDAAISKALEQRTDITRAKKDVDNADSNARLASNQRMPDVRLTASYTANGLGGTEVLRTGGFPGTIIGPGAITPFGTVLDQLFGRDYPTWTAGVSVSYPIGHSADEATYARTRLERAQADERVKSAEGKVIEDVRTAGWNIEMNARRIQTTRAARDLAEQRLDAERKRFEVGISTSFLVIQAQRDLSQATTNELAAVLAYDLSLVDFDTVQQAPPAR
ncbi:MAG TPA: TolC family protein [Vicinamibacterales bacterium]|jgi:outer membrane protein TolC|nr:TolC family protein [Vicinamibacterales bacterium]